MRSNCGTVSGDADAILCDEAAISAIERYATSAREFAFARYAKHLPIRYVGLHRSNGYTQLQNSRTLTDSEREESSWLEEILSRNLLQSHFFNTISDFVLPFQSVLHKMYFE